MISPKAQAWVKGLAAAFITGGAGSLVQYVADAQTSAGDLLRIFVVSGLIGAASYLKSSPLPRDEG